MPADRIIRQTGLGGISLPRVLLSAALLFVAVILAASGLIVAELRRKELADAQRELTVLNTVLAEEAARTLQSVDLVLRSVSDGLVAEGVTTGEAYARKGDRETHELLKAKVAGVPQLDAVTMVGADGRLINFSRRYPVPAIDISDRDYFAELRDNPIAEPYVTGPVQNRGSGTWTVFLARRLAGPDGRFVGLVLGTIDLGYFDNFYRSLNLGGHAAVSLWRRDGTLLTREPPLPGVGRQFKLKAFTEERLRAGAGFYEIEDSVDGMHRLVSTRATRGYPLILNVTRTRDEVLGDWYREAFVTGGAAAASATAILLILWTLSRQRRADSAAADALREREQAIEAREAVEEQLRQAQKMEAVGQLTGGIAHDFNNLLTGIIGSLELLQTRLAQGRTDTIDRYVGAAIASAERAGALTHRLLAFARRQPLSTQIVDANALLQGMADLLARTLGKQIAFEIAPGQGLWPTLCDPHQLESAVLNLAINARDAMPGGGRLVLATRNVHLDAARLRRHPDVAPGDYVCVSVRDTGTGMTPEVAAKAFEPFFTTKPLGQGTGLGLSMIYGFARQSEGHAEIETAPGKGTTVRIYLPRHGDTVPVEEAVAPKRAARAHRGETVLLVEDEPVVRALVHEVLDDLGYTVLEASDGPAGLALARGDARIDLLVTDVGLPGLDGRSLAEQARAERPGLKVLFMTGYADNALFEDGAAAPATQLVTKPFAVDALAERVRSLLGA
ncbi:response regulator [Methylobacterium organophilum]|uniref:hybrid sensor histidine kinase/response regulator n=1 Tax=Methylobacterium organophilum TaxID=410 RepID=UPI001F128CA3|nr:hybrid sensor histidine kinase/response regulator [Methylobacterium organophilum]UMY18849.1 response regulator [Methylobacterium organophilum]